MRGDAPLSAVTQVLLTRSTDETQGVSICRNILAVRAACAFRSLLAARPEDTSLW